MSLLINRVIENNISVINNNDLSETSINYSSSLLKSIPVSNGNIYVCIDTKNIYVDNKNNRTLLGIFNYINSETDRVTYNNPSLGYYYVNETNVLWIYNGKWIIYADNKLSNYPGTFININNNSNNIYGDSFNFLVNKNFNNNGSLIINPDISINVTDKDGKIERVVKSHDYGTMIFNGDYYSCKNGKIRLVTDDGCIDDMIFGDPPDN